MRIKNKPPLHITRDMINKILKVVQVRFIFRFTGFFVVSRQMDEDDESGVGGRRGLRVCCKHRKVQKANDC